MQGPWLLFHSWFILIIINVKCMLMPRCNPFILLSPHSILLSQHKVDHRLFSRILIEFPSSPNLHNTTNHHFYQSTFYRGTNEISCPFLQYISFVLISLCQNIIIVRAQKSYTTLQSLVAVINYFYY